MKIAYIIEVERLRSLGLDGRHQVWRCRKAIEAQLRLRFPEATVIVLFQLH
ncbi:MAG: hypothetical protein HY901_06765, partial [Deltaproteobacteria bacterium]|nr:hypothetical protein [Deltaproteobacteria bacterium]